jgi:tRNA(Ile)-lysidine synthase TilS/MesJ
MLLAHLVLSFREEKKWNNSNVNLLHCNHRIRKESEEEKEFLKKYFSNKNLIIFERDTSKYPNENEESLRERRYSEFSTCCKKNNIKYLCL